MTSDNTLIETPASHGKFPPFQSENFPSQLVWLVLTFALLYVLMTKIALPRIGFGISERSKRIAEDIAAAQAFKERSDAAQAAYETMLAEARTQGQDIMSAERQRRAAAAEATNKRLEAELHGRLSAAEKSIAASREAAIENVGIFAAETAAAIVARLLSQTPSPYEVAVELPDAAEVEG
jgi:F-type H+-transporting ATPase subunit b